MILYHGSKEIVEFPEIRTARYNKDFYFGFYCTQMPEQAVILADGAAADDTDFQNVFHVDNLPFL